MMFLQPLVGVLKWLEGHAGFSSLEFVRGILMPWYSEALSFTSPMSFCLEVLLVLRLHPRMTSKANTV